MPHTEKVSSTVRQRYDLSPKDRMKDRDVNEAIWSIFVSVTLQAAFHFGIDYTENLRSTKNQPKKPLRQLFQVTRKLITDQTQITSIKTIDRRQLMSTLLADRAVLFSIAQKKPSSFLAQCCCMGK